MAIKDGIRTLLLAQSSITTLAPAQTVGSKSYGAIFVDKVKQGIVPPFIEISRTGSDAMPAMDGTTGMKSTEIDIDCWEWTEPKAEALATVVSEFLKDYSGSAGSDVIDSVLWEDTNDFKEPEQGGSDKWRYAVTLSFTIQHH